MFKFITGDDALLDMVENSPSVDIPPLRKPDYGQTLDGPIGQYQRQRFLDMSCLSENLRATKRALEDENNNWSKNGIPLPWKVNSAVKSGQFSRVIANLFRSN